MDTKTKKGGHIQKTQHKLELDIFATGSRIYCSHSHSRKVHINKRAFFLPDFALAKESKRSNKTHQKKNKKTKNARGECECDYSLSLSHGLMEHIRRNPKTYAWHDFLISCIYISRSLSPTPYSHFHSSLPLRERDRAMILELRS